MIYCNDDVAIPFPEEPGPLFRLQLVQEDILGLDVDKTVQVGRFLPVMDPGVVALGRLQRRADLYAIHIPGLNLGLHQEIEDAIEFFGENPEIADFGLDDDGLVPFRAVPEIGLHMDSLDTEEAPGIVPETSVFINVPSCHLGEGDGVHFDGNLLVASGNPVQQFLRTVERIVGCQ